MKTEMLAALNVRRSELGVVGWASHKIGVKERDLYLPLRIMQSGPMPADRVQLVVSPAAELSEVFVTLARVGADGRPGNALLNHRPLGYGYYPAERAVSIPISGLTTPGVYVVELGATLRGGGASSVRLWFLYSGR
jgi:hypothetical protein